MSDKEKQAEIKNLISHCEEWLLSNSEKNCSAEVVSSAKTDIGDHLSSIRHRLHLVEYIKDIILGYDWQKYHEFDEYANESQDRSVSQVSTSGKITCTFMSRRDMENYFFCNLITYFSLIAGIVDNLAHAIKSSFNLDLGGKITTPTRVHSCLPDGGIKTVLYEGIVSDKDFSDMMEVRKQLEHYAHNKVFPFGKRPVMSALGGWHSDDVPFVNAILTKNLSQKNRRADRYCEFINMKLTNFLKTFFSTVLTVEKI